MTTTAELSIAAGLALAQETSYQAGNPREEETEAELAARGCMYHYRMYVGSLILANGRTLGDDGQFMIIELRPVLILSDGRPDTTSDPFGRTLTAYRARDLLSGREGNLTYGALGVVRVEPQLPYAPLAAEAAEHLAQLAGVGHRRGRIMMHAHDDMHVRTPEHPSAVPALQFTGTVVTRRPGHPDRPWIDSIATAGDYALYAAQAMNAASADDTEFIADGTTVTAYVHGMAHMSATFEPDEDRPYPYPEAYT